MRNFILPIASLAQLKFYPESRSIPKPSGFGRAQAFDPKAEKSISWSAVPDRGFWKGHDEPSQPEGNKQRKLTITFMAVP
jgi:hypothetical protein